MKVQEKGLLYWNTIKNLEPVQIRHQILNRVKKRGKPQKYVSAPKYDKIRIAIPELDKDEEYLKRFDVEALMRNEVLLLHERHGLNGAWKEYEASHLWNYNLHYLEFLVPLSVKHYVTGEEKYKSKYVEILTSWLDSADRNKDAYEPYTISMRIPNLLIGMEFLGELGETLEQKIYASLIGQYKYLQQHLELALLANHYLENLKAIVIGSIFFHEQDVYHKYFDLFLRQVKEQVLPDGMHYERSLMYHKIILEGLLRVYKVLSSSHHNLDAEKLLPWIRRMAEAMGSLENGFVSTPLFNDAGDNVGKSCAALFAACREVCGELDTGKMGFPDAGYYRLDYRNCKVLFDCGDIGPKYMGGHAHNDCLSFELAIDGKKIFTNSGTGQYQGNMRKFFRSTAAHNTMMIDDREQSELWGEHRAARRISHIRAVFKENAVAGQFRSYQGDCFRRKMSWKDNALVIVDDIRSSDAGRHMARQFFHLVSEYRFERMEDGVKVLHGEKPIAVLKTQENADILIHKEGQITVYAPEFGKYEKKQVLEIRMPFENCVKLKTAILVRRHIETEGD